MLPSIQGEVKLEGWYGTNTAKTFTLDDTRHMPTYFHHANDVSGPATTTGGIIQLTLAYCIIVLYCVLAFFPNYNHMT